MDSPPPRINQRRHQPRPDRLVTCTQTGTDVAVKVFTEHFQGRNEQIGGGNQTGTRQGELPPLGLLIASAGS